MSVLRNNLKEWFSTVIGAIILLILVVNFFTLWPRELTISQQLAALVIAGVFLFGNPKTFFARLEKIFTQKLEK